MGKHDGQGKEGKKRKRDKEVAHEEEHEQQPEAAAPVANAVAEEPRQQQQGEDGADAEDGERPRLLVSSETSEYLQEIVGHFKTLIDDEERSLLVGNVLEEIAGKEALIAADPICSRHVELLMAAAQPQQLLMYLASISEPEAFYAVVSRCCSTCWGKQQGMHAHSTTRPCACVAGLTLRRGGRTGRHRRHGMHGCMHGMRVWEAATHANRHACARGRSHTYGQRPSPSMMMAHGSLPPYQQPTHLRGETPSCRNVHRSRLPPAPPGPPAHPTLHPPYVRRPYAHAYTHAWPAPLALTVLRS